LITASIFLTPLVGVPLMTSSIFFTSLLGVTGYPLESLIIFSTPDTLLVPVDDLPDGLEGLDPEVDAFLSSVLRSIFVAE
jgi:hypothetical protein